MNARSVLVVRVTEFCEYCESEFEDDWEFFQHLNNANDCPSRRNENSVLSDRAKEWEESERDEKRFRFK